MKKLIFPSLFALCASLSANAQQIIEEPKHFSTHAHTADGGIIWHYPELKEQAAQYIKDNPIESNPLVTVGQEKSNTEYTISVVFHILHVYGNENINDAQVYQAMEVINREFNASDPDSADIVPEFQALHANTKIAFKLAAKDPFGNCTNGIEHIYTHETNVGDAFSKVNQWNRAKYLNIWVVDVVGAPGAAAYAVKPGGTDGAGFWVDGIVSSHTYVGGTGTSNPGREATLTHEIGHYLNLDHPWGPTNETGQGCGDDGVADTPVTQGFSSCPLGNADICNPGIQENVQNYMEYSFCSRHFTPGQVTFMHNALEGVPGQRNQLSEDSTLIETGVKDLEMPQDPANELSVPLCTPVADFSANRTNACVGSLVTFTDASWNAVVSNREWTFEDGNPASSTSAIANVSFDSPGWKKITLTASNAAGADTKEETKYIYISGGWGENEGPTMFDMESDNASGTGTNFFLTQNPEDNFGEFEVVNGVGYDGSRAWKLGNYFDNSQADPYTDAAFYNQRLGLSEDHLITPSIDLRYTTNVVVTFKFAYATNATAVADITENLKVSTSNNCGESWTTRIVSVDGNLAGSTITGNDLVTGGYAGYTDFAPQNNQMWKEGSFSFNTGASDNNTRIRFSFEASDNSSNFYVDNIQISGTLNAQDDFLNEMDIQVYPNPSQGEAISVNYFAQNLPVTFTLRDAHGKVISQEENAVTNTTVTHKITNSSTLSSGCYLLEIQSSEYSTVKKIIVL